MEEDNYKMKDLDILFTTDDWKPICFHMEPHGAQRQRIKDLIEDNCGRLYDMFPRTQINHMIRLVNPGAIIFNKDEDFFDIKYVENCVQEGKLLPNLIDYRVNEKSKFKEYNPFDVMVARIKWDQIEKKAQGEIVDFDDFGEGGGVESIENNKKYLDFRENSARMPYSTGEDIAIIRYIDERRVYGQVDGNNLWKIMQHSKVCKRSYQSMKERFRKKILPCIGSYGLKSAQIRCFQEKRDLYVPDRFTRDQDSESDRSISPPKDRSRLRDRSSDRNKENSSPSRRSRRPDHGNSQSSPRHHHSKSTQSEGQQNQTEERPLIVNEPIENDINRPNSSRLASLKEAIFGSTTLPSTSSSTRQGAEGKLPDSASEEDEEPFRAIQPPSIQPPAQVLDDGQDSDIAQTDDIRKKSKKTDKQKNITESCVVDDISIAEGIGKRVLAAATADDSQLKDAANGSQLRDAAPADESQLREAAPMILSQDVIDTSIVASSAVKRTFSTDSDRSPRKKRKLYCPETSKLNEDVANRLRVFQVPSPVLTGDSLLKKKASAAKKNNLDDVAVSSQEFAAGLRAASDASSSVSVTDSEDGGLQVTDTNLGGLTSTQNLIDTPQSVHGKAAPTKASGQSVKSSSMEISTAGTIQPVDEAYEVADGVQELNLGPQHSSKSQDNKEESNYDESPNLLRNATEKEDEIGNNPDAANESILTNDVSAMIPLEKDIFASDSEISTSPIKGTVSNNDVYNRLNIDLPGSNSRQTIEDPCGQSSIRPLNVQENEQQNLDHNLNDVDGNNEAEQAANQISSNNNDYVVDDIEKEMEALHGGDNIVEGQDIEDLPADENIVEDDDVEDLPGVITAAGREDEVVTDDDAGERVEESEEEIQSAFRVRNKTTFQKAAPKPQAGGRKVNVKDSKTTGGKSRDLLLIKLPNDIGSSDIEIVRPNHRREHNTRKGRREEVISSQEESSSQEVYKPKPSFSCRLRLSEKKKKRRQEKLAKRLQSPKEITKFLDASGSESSTDDGNESPVLQKGEPVKPKRRQQGNRICDDSSDISSDDENGVEKSKERRPLSRNKACDSSSDESSKENKKSDANDIGANQRKRQLFPNDRQNKPKNNEGGNKTPSVESNRQGTGETSPAPSHHRRQSGDVRMMSPEVGNGKRRHRFKSSGEAHAEMVARSPRAACCSGINTVSGKIQRRRSSAMNAPGPQAPAFNAPGPQAPAFNETASSLESVDSADDPEPGPSGVKYPRKLTIRITRRKEDKPAGNKFREPYTLEEEKKLLGHFQIHGGYSRFKGKAIWKEMEKRNLLPGRTWQSMKGHFIKIIQDADKLDMFGCTVEQLKDSDKEVYRVDEEGEEENREWVHKKKNKLYSVEEDKKILNYICENKRYGDTGGIAMWKVMEERKVVGSRSYQSMKERFKKVIIKNIENEKYGLDDEKVEEFLAICGGNKNAAKQKRHKK